MTLKLGSTANYRLVSTANSCSLCNPLPRPLPSFPLMCYLVICPATDKPTMQNLVVSTTPSTSMFQFTEMKGAFAPVPHEAHEAHQRPRAPAFNRLLISLMLMVQLWPPRSTLLRACWPLALSESTVLAVVRLQTGSSWVDCYCPERGKST